MVLSTVITYLSGLLISRSNQCKDAKKRSFGRRLWVALSILLNLAILFFFKYFHFAALNVNRVLAPLSIQILEPSFDVLLPVGISFYTFKVLSYTIDVYRGEIQPSKNLFKYALFVSFFPQLMAGPIERPKNLIPQLDERHDFDFNRMKNGLLLMLWGYFQKMVIADRAAILVNQVYDHYSDYGMAAIILATLFFSVQIYCDFCGYSDIAIGASQIMGFKVMENFKRPYFAVSLRDFWLRWHISLSAWFRDYVYRPISVSLVKRRWKLKSTYFVSSFTVWLLTGLWHGASWNYIVWGGFHGSVQIIGDIIKPWKEKVYRALGVRTGNSSFQPGRMLITFLIVNFAWIFFRAPGAKAALLILQQIFRGGILTGIQNIGLDVSNLLIAFVSMLILLAVNLFQEYVGDWRAKLEERSRPLRWLVYIAAINAVIIFGVYGIEYDATQFFYFQF